jgi:Major Facilitator Superfamily
MAFFRNSAVNLLNLHTGILTIGLSGGGAFFAAYLLKSGLPAAGVFLSLAAVLLGRFIIRPIVIGLAARWGLRPMLVAGTLLSALQYPFLAEVHGVGTVLLELIAVSAVADTFYWTTYHAHFAALGDNDFRGHQIGAREAVAAIVGIASPLLTGWMLVAFGPRVAFYATSAVIALAALPLLWMPRVTVPARAPGGFKAALPGMLLFMADGWIAAGYWLAWQISLFLSLGEDFVAYGAALAFAAVVGAIAGLILGRHIDAGHGRRAVWYALGTLALVILFRAGATNDPKLAVLANAVGALAMCLYIPTLMTAVYTLAKRSPCTLRFHVASEGGWDLGGTCGLCAAALTSGLGLPLSASILPALAGVAASGVMLSRYYASSPVSMAEIGS